MLPERYPRYDYALFRIVIGLRFILHAPRIVGDARPVPEVPRREAAAIIELVGGALIMVGLFVRPAAFIASGQMAVAYFMLHAPRGFWPNQNGGELAALYCFAFLYMATRDAGAWSAD